ncbi:MAG: hypothetical protein NTV31_15345 [Bacteroidia bacterium]|nr:hypothetical protein [Bacteroidia bacterium]
MASIIPGYEYDIFISYRQKDNKHDGWVTEFDDNLKQPMVVKYRAEHERVRKWLEEQGML